MHALQSLVVLCVAATASADSILSTSGIGRKGKLAVSETGDSIVGDESYMREDGDYNIENNSGMLDVSVVMCPTRKSLYCSKGDFCCSKATPICCSVDDQAKKFCCPKSYPYCGKNGRCFKKA